MSCAQSVRRGWFAPRQKCCIDFGLEEDPIAPFLAFSAAISAMHLKTVGALLVGRSLGDPYERRAVFLLLSRLNFSMA